MPEASHPLEDLELRRMVTEAMNEYGGDGLQEAEKEVLVTQICDLMEGATTSEETVGADA